MSRAPVKFNRVAEAFGTVACGRLCESSGNEHSPESSVGLSDLVDSFIERESEQKGEHDGLDPENDNESDSESWRSGMPPSEELDRLFGYEGDKMKQKIYAEAHQAWRIAGEASSPGFKRRLMTRLRERGFDAGLCKSKWERTGRVPPGLYEYVDVKHSDTRYILEVSLASEFEIAKATPSYASLLATFPPIFVGRVQEFKQVARLVSAAMKVSMKQVGMSVPPWRRLAYLQARWFGSYKRTINEVPAEKASGSSKVSDRRSAGFVTSPGVSCRSRESFSSKSSRPAAGLLAMAFQGH